MFWKKHKPKKETETPDPTPVAMPVNFHRPPSLQEQMRKYVRNSLNNYATQNGKETFEEANDFDIGEIDPASPYELEFGDQQEARFEQYVVQTQQEHKKRASLKAKAAKQREENQTDPAGSVVPPKTDSK